ncbi:MAG: hypothetical protein ACPGU1_21550 [Myxococcota bacterium]
MLQRAFNHVGCKAAHVGAMTPEGLAAFGEVGAALWTSRSEPRGRALHTLLEGSFSHDAHTLYAELDAMDRSLDASTGDAPWLFGRVPAHCHRLWPLRNVMRLAERQGVLLREMSFTAYEAEDSFVPDLPVACLDASIYGGGFDHDLFHHLLPVAPPGDAFDFEASMLVVESAAQAYNSLVLAARYEGPEYEGHAPWPGAALFERLSVSFQRQTIPELVSAYSRLGLVCHPDLDADPVTTWSALLGPSADPDALRELVTEHARYVRLDADWLRTLRPRYEAPIMDLWREPLAERLAPDAGSVISGLDDLLWALEDVDLRDHDAHLIGRASTLQQQARWLWMRALELHHLCVREGAERPATLSDTLGAVASLNRTLRAHVAACTQQTHRRPVARDTSVGERLLKETDALGESVDRATYTIEGIARDLRSAQRGGTLGGPVIPEFFIRTHRELFAGVDYQLPVHVGADGPGAPE